MKKFCIVIPVYKEHLDSIEKLSLTKLWETIKEKNYDVFFVRPNGVFNMSEYYDLIPGWKNKVFEQPFDKNYFKGTDTYSQLCINMDFYLAFSEYEYMYIYQLDVYLIKDNFEFFCNLGYDYIGAPIISNCAGWPVSCDENNGIIPAVGNGGFSLRKIQTFIEITDPNGDFRQSYGLTDDKLKDIIYEDLYFCTTVKDLYDFNIATPDVALSFGWDMSVDILYEIWKLPLPMALHAWDKNIRIWKDILPELKDNSEIINLCEEKHKEFFKVYYDENNHTYRNDTTNN